MHGNMHFKRYIYDVSVNNSLMYEGEKMLN
jgi:hypothetical protein